MDHHDTVVAAIAAQAGLLYAGKIPWRVNHGGTQSTRKTAHASNKIIDISGLSHVLSIDPLTKTALVEPNVTMESLVKKTLPQLLPPVVPEFPGIAVGGAPASTAGESSSSDMASWPIRYLGSRSYIRLARWSERREIATNIYFMASLAHLAL